MYAPHASICPADRPRPPTLRAQVRASRPVEVGGAPQPSAVPAPHPPAITGSPCANSSGLLTSDNLMQFLTDLDLEYCGQVGAWTSSTDLLSSSTEWHTHPSPHPESLQDICIVISQPEAFQDRTKHATDVTQKHLCLARCPSTCARLHATRAWLWLRLCPWLCPCLWLWLCKGILKPSLPLARYTTRFVSLAASCSAEALCCGCDHGPATLPGRHRPQEGRHRGQVTARQNPKQNPKSQINYQEVPSRAACGACRQASVARWWCRSTALGWVAAVCAQ